MLILSNVLALALVVADEPRRLKAPMPPTPAEAAREAQGVWQMTLPEAIRIGLENSEVVRVISLGAQGRPVGGFEPTPSNPGAAGVEPPNVPGVVIARLNADAGTWNFKSAIMAHVRSIEQQYWALSLQQVSLWSRETAVRLGEEILRRERAELEAGRGTTANVAEAEQQLENFKLNLISATSDLITTERQLRNILGLPSADNRRIVPASAPTEAKVEPTREASVASMLASQPDIAQQRHLVRDAELRAIVEGEDPSLPLERREASKHQLERQQAFLRQVLQQTTRSVDRFLLEVDTNYQQFQTARRLRAAAQQRLEAQRAFHEEGRVTIDRLLDAVAQYSNAIAQEALYKSSYNTSIAALEEAKGTLLDVDKITVIEGPASPRRHVSAKVDQVAPASFEGPAVAPVAPANAPPAPTTYKLRAKLGGVKLLEVEVEVSPSPPVR